MFIEGLYILADKIRKFYKLTGLGKVQEIQQPGFSRVMEVANATNTVDTNHPFRATETNNVFGTRRLSQISATTKLYKRLAIRS